MQTENLKALIAAAQSGKHREPFAKAVRGSIEVGVVVPSIFRAQLEAAGFTLVEDRASMAEYGFASMAVLKRVIITDGDGAIVAMGAADHRDEALLHAALGWFREHPVDGVELTPGIAEAPANPLAPASN